MADERDVQRDLSTRLRLETEQQARQRRLNTLREQGINPYPNRAQRTHTISDILQHFDEWQGP